AMMESVAKKVREINPEILSIAVTILTSFSEDGLKETFKSTLSLKDLALNLAKLTKTAGMDE
ncbi:MAG: orotidine-5'-phosphate decarboxylase, partial [Cetobacterium sp.]